MAEEVEYTLDLSAYASESSVLHTLIGYEPATAFSRVGDMKTRRTVASADMTVVRFVVGEIEREAWDDEMLCSLAKPSRAWADPPGFDTPQPARRPYAPVDAIRSIVPPVQEVPRQASVPRYLLSSDRLCAARADQVQPSLNRHRRACIRERMCPRCPRVHPRVHPRNLHVALAVCPRDLGHPGDEVLHETGEGGSAGIFSKSLCAGGRLHSNGPF